jgi:squalene-hopene/tetraprenyl-beta-curcumene cyclase
MRNRAVVLAAGMLAVAFVIAGRAAPPDAPATGWDKAAAAAYLDARMDAWWPKAKTLKTGSGDAKCLSCHTTVPYVLARPALRVAMGQSSPTPHEELILDVVRRRVEHRGAPQPYYDHTDAKKVESRGVEAVLNALVLTQHDALGRSAQPSDSTRAAMAQLWAAQRADGAWDWLEFGLEPYEAPDAVFHGATLAALAAGTSPGANASTDAAGRAGLERLRGYLRGNAAAQRLFNRAWLLMADAQLRGLLPAEERAAIVTALERAQRADGGWSLADLGPWRWTKTSPPFAAPGTTDAALLAPSDGFATGLAVHALKRAGEATRPAVARGVAWLVANQRPVTPNDQAWAPWRAHSLNHDREHGGDRGEPWRRMFMSDLATAFAVLALAQ